MDVNCPIAAINPVERADQALSHGMGIVASGDVSLPDQNIAVIDDHQCGGSILIVEIQNALKFLRREACLLRC